MHLPPQPGNPAAPHTAVAAAPARFPDTAPRKDRAATGQRAAHAAVRYPRAFIEWKLSAGSPRAIRIAQPQRQRRQGRRALCGYLETWRRIGVRPDSVQVLGGTLSSLRLPTGVIGVALSWHAVSPGTARGEAGKGFVLLEVAVPSLPDITRRGEEERR